MEFNEIDILFNNFLKQDRIFEPQLKSFETKLLNSFGSDKESKAYVIKLLSAIKKEFKNGIFTGVKSINQKHQTSAPKNNPTAKSKKEKKPTPQKKKPSLVLKTKKDKKKYVVPASKNKINENDAILLKLRIEYIRKPHSISMLANVLQFNEASLIDVITSCGFENINSSTIVKMEHITPLAEQIFDRRKEILAFESEIVSKNPKTKPNYFRLIYNSPGSKR
jgi:hypothetical protein